MLRLWFEPGPYCIWVQYANHSATEPPYVGSTKIQSSRFSSKLVRKLSSQMCRNNITWRNVWHICHSQWPIAWNFFSTLLPRLISGTHLHDKLSIPVLNKSVIRYLRMLTTWHCLHLPATSHSCSSWSVSPACQAHSSKLAAAGLLLWLLWAHAGTDRRTPYSFTDSALHTMQGNANKRCYKQMLKKNDHFKCL